MEHCSRSQRHPRASSREDRHVTRMTLMDRAATSRALSREMGFARQEWRDDFFPDESRFCLQHLDGRIRVRWHRGECTLRVCIRHRHSGPSSGMMIWGAIGYTSQ
ncbi:transposable element Tcb1 transposase [Trichonephila clavipes]|uniref:Transposable element Tcb1 transposase n=1 Tax=Trichonephila clavipes TaxID=2585209 RepID=A0A8X6VB64_TRICX|nr:transposable element Tcb1 transposase [Trichonephila clavipes]